MYFGQRVKKELAYQNIQAKELAITIGVPYSTLLAQLNSKERLPNVLIGYKISKALNVSIEYLVTGNETVKYKQDVLDTASKIYKLPFKMQSFITELIDIISTKN